MICKKLLTYCQYHIATLALVCWGVESLFKVSWNVSCAFEGKIHMKYDRMDTVETQLDHPATSLIHLSTSNIISCQLFVARSFSVIRPKPDTVKNKYHKAAFFGNIYYGSLLYWNSLWLQPTIIGNQSGSYFSAWFPRNSMFQSWSLLKWK